MRMLDLFSGIGGFSLAAQWCWGDELEIVSFVEIDPFCQKVLKKHWPNVPIIGDVRDVKENEFGTIDLLTGGFPCQPFSVAGKRKGKEDNRFLWPEMLRIVQEFKPHWIVAENVAGIIRMALDDCLSDLEGEGYATGTVIIPACAVNAPHRRNRVWIVANSKRCDTIGIGKNDVNATSCRFKESGGKMSPKMFTNRSWWSIESRLGGIFNGIPDWSHESESIPRTARGVPERINRLKSLGNAIVPQVAYQIMMAIKEIEDKSCQ